MNRREYSIIIDKHIVLDQFMDSYFYSNGVPVMNRLVNLPLITVKSTLRNR